MDLEEEEDEEQLLEESKEDTLKIETTQPVEQPIETGRAARETLMQRFREYMSLPETIEVECIPGEALDYSQFEQRFPISNSRLFSQLKFKRSHAFTNRVASMFSCDYASCGKFFKKI